MVRMSRALLTGALLAAAGNVAFADPHAALILRSEGAADAPTRARVDALVLRLAKAGGVAATAGDISYGDAAAATGCKPEAATCRDEVLATLGVDEVITATTYLSGGELKVVVRRATKGAPPREATATAAMIDSSDASLEAGLGPLFGVTLSALPPHLATPPPPGATITQPPTGLPLVGEHPPPSDGSNVTAAPNGEVTTPADDVIPHHKLEMAGAIGGGVAILLGFVLWGAAKSTQSDINAAPTKTASDLAHLHDLEQQGDGQANGGNFLFVAGAVVGGISGYYLYRDHKRAASAAAHARITPVLVDHGAGIALTFGGLP